MRRLKIPIPIFVALLAIIALFVTPITQAGNQEELAPVTAITTTAPTSAEQATGQAIFAGTMGETARDIVPTMAAKPYTLHKAIYIDESGRGHDRGQYAEKPDLSLLMTTSTIHASPRAGRFTSSG